MTATEILTEARRLAAEAGGARLPAGDVASLLGRSGGGIDELMLALVPLAAELASPPISRFEVGAVGQGASGALYFGANLELTRGPLGDTVHAEQATVVNAIGYQESGLLRLAVSAAPCGHCRQFLWELSTADQLEILVAGRPAERLATLLPRAFGPADLGHRDGLMGHGPVHLVFDTTPAGRAAQAAADSAAASYAPYSNSPAGVGLVTRDGTVYRGPYVENAAFNPSLAPLLAAMTLLMLDRQTGADVVEAALVRLKDTMIDHDAWARRLLKRCAPAVSLEIIPARLGKS